MRTNVVWLCVFCSSFFVGGCFAWPSAVWPSGEVHVKAAERDSAKTSPEKFRAVVVKYWYHEGVNDIPSSVQVLDVFVTEKPDFSVTYGPRPYFVVFTPVFGAQHLAPEPSVAVFVDGYWPTYSRFNYGRHCCEGPETGYAIFHLGLISLDQAPPEHYAPDQHFPFSGRKIEDIEATLQWYWLEESDRQIVVRGMKKFLAASSR